jgi:hypothetical protein
MGMMRHEIEVTVERFYHTSTDGPTRLSIEVIGDPKGIQEGMECVLSWDTRHECKDLIAVEQHIDLSSGAGLLIYNQNGIPQYPNAVTFCPHCGVKLQVA